MAAAQEAGYTRYQYWSCTANQAAKARAAAMEFDFDDWDSYMHNCWHMVYYALSEAETNVQDFGSSPNMNFLQNQSFAQGSGDLE